MLSNASTEKLRKCLWTVPKKLDTIRERKSEKFLFFLLLCGL